VVGSEGVWVGVLGGSTRTVGSLDTLVFDASASSDLDSSTCLNCLSFTWSCSQVAPYFGNHCDPLVTSPGGYGIMSIDATSVLTPSSFAFTVRGVSSSGAAGVAQVLLHVTPASLPSVLLDSSIMRVNPGDRLLLAGAVTAGNYTALARWSCANLSDAVLANVSLSPLTRAIDPGSSIVFQLALPPGLTAGLLYAFTLSVRYPGLSVFASASLLVTVNSAPYGGMVTVAPQSGIALNTSFAVASSGWTDDVNDLPLSYTLHLAPSLSSGATVGVIYLMSLSTIAYTTAFLPATDGPAAIIATAIDIFGDFIVPVV
jgi:hypothetical protein